MYYQFWWVASRRVLWIVLSSLLGCKNGRHPDPSNLLICAMSTSTTQFFCMAGSLAVWWEHRLPGRLINSNVFRGQLRPGGSWQFRAENRFCTDSWFVLPDSSLGRSHNNVQLNLFGWMRQQLNSDKVSCMEGILPAFAVWYFASG